MVGLQVTNVTDRAVELRALVSTEDASKGWDLRCAVREHLIGVLQRLEGGRYLPRNRLEAELGSERSRRNVAVLAPPAS